MDKLIDEGKSVSLARQIKCVQREVGFRERVYPRRIARGSMKQAQADEETAVMRAVLATLEELERRRASAKA